MSTNELWFTVLGPSGCGKTTLLACMNEYFARVMNGAFMPENEATFKKLSEAYSRLRLEAEDNDREIIFSGGIEGTDTAHEYSFTLKGSRKNVRVRFFDFPGGWINPRNPEQSSHFEEVSEKASGSSVIMAVINSPYLMQYDGKYKNYAGIDEMEYVIEKSLAESDEDKLIILVPVKCEKYLAKEKETGQLREAVKKAFSRTIKLASISSPYYGKLAIALLPVKTMGNVQLSRFEVKEGEPLQVFRKITGSRFMPEDTDQPLRYAMSFLLEQYKKINSRSKLNAAFNFVFGMGNPDKTIASIREGISENISGSEIISGRELIGLPDGE